jgi:hypothetical protein
MSCVTWAVLAVPHFCVRDEESGLLILSGPFELIDTYQSAQRHGAGSWMFTSGH